MDIDITQIFSFLLAQFETCANWLFSNYIKIGGFRISYGMLAIMILVIHIVFNLVLPWFDSDREGENE